MTPRITRAALASLLLFACGDDKGAAGRPVVEDDMTKHFTTVCTDATFGVGCAMYTTTVWTGKVAVTESHFGVCFPSSKAPAWTASLAPESMHLRDHVEHVVIDDQNSLVCLQRDGEIRDCFDQADMDPASVAALRAEL